jgi:hypothetical protein
MHDHNDYAGIVTTYAEGKHKYQVIWCAYCGAIALTTPTRRTKLLARDWTLPSSLEAKHNERPGPDGEPYAYRHLPTPTQR